MNELLVVAMRSDLVRVARLIGAPEGVAPSITRYREIGRYGEKRVQAAVGGWTSPPGKNVRPRLCWSDAMRRYGLEPWSSALRVRRRDLVEDLRRVARLAGRGPKDMPTVEEYRELGHYSWITIYDHLGGGRDGSWYTAADNVGLRPSRHVRRGELSRESLIDDYRALAHRMGMEPGGSGPSRAEFGRAVKYSATAAGYRFGSWDNFVTAAGYEPATTRFERRAS